MAGDLAERIAHFIRYLGDPNALVRQTAVRWLGRWGGAQAVLPLWQQLGDPSSYVRWETIRSLAQMGDARVLPALRALTRIWSDEPDFIREAAAAAITRITARGEAVTGRELAPVPEPPQIPRETEARALAFAEEEG